MMSNNQETKERNPQDPFSPWSPLYRTNLETLLETHDYTTAHLSILAWLIWMSLLSIEDLQRLCSRKGQRINPATLSVHLRKMVSLGLIDSVTLRESPLRAMKRYYATDLGLYLYLSATHPSPTLSIARLANAYRVERYDLLTRLARPQIHVACVSLATHIIAEEEALGHRLTSYQQPWHHMITLAQKRYLYSSDAALLLEQQDSGVCYAFLIFVDTGPHERSERDIEKWLLLQLELRQQTKAHRLHWPHILIISTQSRLPLWAQLQEETAFKRATKPLAGGITTLEALDHGVTTPIWWDMEKISPKTKSFSNRLPLSDFLRDPASPELKERFSNERHFFEILLKDAATPPPRTKQHLARYVGDSLQDEAAQLTRERIETFFLHKRKNRQSMEGTGLLTLMLTAAEKDILTWAAHHPLLDVPTLQALLRPAALPEAIKPIQQHITHLFQLGLIETRVWSKGKMPLEQQRYLLTPVALKFMATRHGEPYSFYFVSPKHQKDDDGQLDRQWGTRGLNGQMGHTNALYAFMRHLYHSTHRRGEIIYQWKSAHEAARWYRDTITQDDEHVRPDAELVFALSPTDQPIRMVLLEYDRGTTGVFEYTRKFTAYLDYQQATGKPLPLLVVATSKKAIERMQHTLETLQGSLPVMMFHEKDILSHGFALIIHHHLESSPS